MFHISNRYLDLTSVVTAVADNLQLVSAVKDDASVTPEDFKRDMYARSIVAVIARSEKDIARLSKENGWVRHKPSVRPWTDDYSNILSSIWRMQTAR